MSAALRTEGKTSEKMLYESLFSRSITVSQSADSLLVVLVKVGATLIQLKSLSHSLQGHYEESTRILQLL